MVRYKNFSRAVLSLVFLYSIPFSSILFSQPYRLISPEIIDFGRVLQGKTVDGSIRFINPGRTPLRIEQVQTSCGCTAAKLEKNEIAPDDTAVIHFTFRTSGFHGLIRKTLTVYFAKESVNDLTVTIQANVYSELEVKPTFISFTSIPLRKDTTVAASFKIMNNSSRSIRVLNIRSDSDQIQVEFQPFSIPPNQESVCRVLLRPKKAEYRNAAVTIETDYSVKPRILIPVLFDIYE